MVEKEKRWPYRMKLLLLGATGRVGHEILTQSLAEGHRVHALVRDPGKLGMNNANLTVTQGNCCEQEDIDQAVQGSEMVFSALSTDGGSVLTDSMPFIIASMTKYGVRRIVTIGTAGILESKEYPGMLRYETPDSRRSSIRAAEEHRRTWELLKGSGLDWTVVCPTYLPQGERIGHYRVERNLLPEGGRSISVADTAEFAYKQLFSQEYVGARVGIAY
jgi:putative NADH-flavin reductase